MQHWAETGLVDFQNEEDQKKIRYFSVYFTKLII